MRRDFCLCGFLLLVLAVSGCRKHQDPQPTPSAPSSAAAGKEEPESRGPVRAELKGVNFRVAPDVVLEVHLLRGELEPTHEGKPPWFDDPTSFDLKIDQAEIAVSPASMAAALNRYAFNGPNAPVKDVEIKIENGHLVQSSTLNKKVPIRATLEGDLSVTPEGDIRFHPTKIKAGDLPVKGLLNLFDLELSELIKPQESKGVKVVDNDLILDPERLLPPPKMKGQVTAVRIEGDRIIQTFGTKGRNLTPSYKADHYMYYQGGELSFGKTTMHGADLEIIDADPKDPFDFFLAQYAKQLTAGYSRTLKNQGLVVYMPDSDEAEGGRLVP
jgi:hypothetical protein